MQKDDRVKQLAENILNKAIRLKKIALNPENLK